MASNFEALKEVIPASQVILPGDAGYDDSIKRWSSACVLPAVSIVKESRAMVDHPDPRALW